VECARLCRGFDGQGFRNEVQRKNTMADTPMMFAPMGGRKITTLAVIRTADRNEAIVACL
jgi:hypothetical protein